MLLFPFFTVWFIFEYEHRFHEHEFERKFGSFYEGIRLDSKMALQWNSFFTLRRLILAYTSIWLLEYPGIQIQITLLITLLQILYLSLVQPFKDKFLNKVEVFNEITIMLVCYHMFLFTSYVPSPEIQIDVGYSAVAMVLMNVLVDMGIILKQGLGDFYEKIRRKLRRGRAVKNRKALMTAEEIAKQRQFNS